MNRYTDGEYMNLTWDGQPDAHYIKGHVSHEDGMETLLDEGVIYEDIVIGHARHIYGRWSTQGDAPEGVTQVLREYNKPGRGRFKITAFGLGIFAKN